MPYPSWKQVNKAIKGIKPKVSPDQANLIASWADRLEGEESVDSPWGAAIANFKKSHHIEEGHWVRNKKLATIEDGQLIQLFDLAQQAQEIAGLDSEEAFDRFLDSFTGQIGEDVTNEGTIEAEDSYEAKQQLIRGALRAQFRSKTNEGELADGPYLQHTYNAHIIMKVDGKTYKVSYTIKDNEVGFGEWEEVIEKKRYVALEDGADLRYFGLLVLDEADTPKFARNRNSDGTPRWIPIHRLGDWEHPQYGPFDMTAEKMDQAVSNFMTCVHRPESPIDAQVPLDTRHRGDAACGWLQEMRVAPPFLWGRVGWTERGRGIVLDQQYRYVSPRYVDDPQRGPIFQEVTLTNRDFLKMPPLDGEGPTVFLSDDERAVIISRTKEEEVSMEKFKLMVNGEEVELTLEEAQAKFQELEVTNQKTGDELEAVKVELEKTKTSQDDTPPASITLHREDGTPLTLSADAVDGMMRDLVTYRKDRKERDVRDVLRQLQEKNVEPIVVQMLKPVLEVLSPEAQALIELEAGPVAKAFGFADEEGEATAGTMNLWTALVKLLEQLPARSTDPRTLLREGVRPANEKPKGEDGQYDPADLTMKELEQAEEEARKMYEERGIVPRSLANQEK